MSIVEIIRCRRAERRSTIEMCRRLEQEDRHNWLVDRVFILHHDELTDFQNKKINDWLSLSLTHDHSRRLTMRQVKVRFNHRSQRKNFFINADSRSFSLIHDAHSESEMHSSSAKTELRRFVKIRFVVSLMKTSCFMILLERTFVSWRFFLLLHSRRRHASWSLSKRTSHFDDFILNTRVLLRAMKILFLLAYLYEQLTIFFNLAYFYERLTILFNYSRISTSNLCRIWSNNSQSR